MWQKCFENLKWERNLFEDFFLPRAVVSLNQLETSLGLFWLLLALLPSFEVADSSSFSNHPVFFFPVNLQTRALIVLLIGISLTDNFHF